MLFELCSRVLCCKNSLQANLQIVFTNKLRTLESKKHSKAIKQNKFSYLIYTFIQHLRTSIHYAL